MADEGFSEQPDLAAEFARGLDAGAKDDDDWGDEPAQSKPKIMVKIREAPMPIASGPIDSSFLSGLGAPPPAGSRRARGNQAQSPPPATTLAPAPTAPAQVEAATPGDVPPPLPGRRPPPGIPPATPAADSPPAEGEGAGLAVQPSVVAATNGAHAEGSSAPAEEDDGFGDLARASSEAAPPPAAAEQSTFANFGGAPTPLELALQDKAELQNEVHELEAQLVMAKVTIAELAAENSKLRHSLAAKGVKVLSARFSFHLNLPETTITKEKLELDPVHLQTVKSAQPGGQ